MDKWEMAVRETRNVLGFAAVTVSLLVMRPTQAAPFAGESPDQYVPGEVLVKFKETTATQARAQTIGRQLSQELEELDPAGLVRIKLKDGQGLAEALSAYQGDPEVEYVQPNYIYKLQALPNDPLFGQMWGLKNTAQTVMRNPAQPDTPVSTHNPGTSGLDMNLVPAWDVVNDCSSVIVGVVDSGINYNHEDLTTNLWNDPAFPNHGFNFVNNTNDPIDTVGHGTHVSGTIGAVGNNGRGSTGVCWKAKIMAVQACNTVGQCTTVSTVSALNFAVAHGAKVINMSLGGSNLDQALSTAIVNAGNSGVVVVVAAGNAGENNDSGTTPTYPCNFPHPNLLCVAALDQAYELASFSNFGSVSVHVAAPGVNVVSTWAGAETRIADNFNTGGVLNWTATTTTSGGWAYRRLLVSGQGVDALVNPPNFPNPSGRYRANTDDRVYKRFNLSGRIAVLSSFTQADLAPNDFLNINIRNAAGDPFVGGTRLFHGGGSTQGIVALPDLDISQFIGPNCTVGFQLATGVGPPTGGLGILGFRIRTLQSDPVTYNVIAGTSMATPHVTGLAAMLMAFNPKYTVADVINSIKKGGTPVAALANKTMTGRAVNALGSVTYINAPTEVAAAVVK